MIIQLFNLSLKCYYIKLSLNNIGLIVFNGFILHHMPTLSLGIIFSSEPCFKKIVPQFYYGLIPTPAFVITADVAGFTPNSSATNLITAVKGAPSGTDSLQYGQSI